MIERPHRLEILESRLLLSSATLEDNIVRVYGDEGVSNVIRVGVSTDKNFIDVDINGTVTRLGGDDIDQVRIFGGALADTITIDETNRRFEWQTRIFAGAGDDLIYCGTERDYVEGQDGADLIKGRGGRNRLFGGNGNDHIIGGSHRNLIVGGPGNDTLQGGLLRNIITGDAGNDEIYGGEEDDLIYAGKGNDLVDGGEGKDVIFGQAGNDSLRGGLDQDEIFGNAGDDTIDGGAKSDTIFGGDGDDLLSSGGGGGELKQGEYKAIDKIMASMAPDYDRD